METECAVHKFFGVLFGCILSFAACGRVFFLNTVSQATYAKVIGMCAIMSWIRIICRWAKARRLYVIEDIHDFVISKRIKKVYDAVYSTVGDLPIDIFLENSSIRSITSSTSDADRLTIKVLAGVRKIRVKVLAKNSSGMVHFDNDSKDQVSYPRRMLHSFAQNAKDEPKLRLQIEVSYYEGLKNFIPLSSASRKRTARDLKSPELVISKGDERASSAWTTNQSRSESSVSKNGDSGIKNQPKKKSRPFKNTPHNAGKRPRSPSEWHSEFAKKDLRNSPLNWHHHEHRSTSFKETSDEHYDRLKAKHNNEQNDELKRYACGTATATEAPTTVMMTTIATPRDL
ncbi:hypothetical protein Tcan_03395 [Toxocara canis]|uniref:Uncharacterized protein n=1 Tax=Toxocara canis TaxID=6265 RepID=A0A0B2V7D3_TOXCA|nr:hypothetical protein Tcan_03395 [Toxocara canis]